jgi:hypothetical protein
MAKLLAGLGIALVVLVVALAWLLSLVDPAVDVPLELAKAVLTLIIAVMVTGVLSAVLSNRGARQAALDERARVLTSALQELKAGYERVQVARFYLAAHRTGEMFRDQIDALTDARARLHKVQRERYVLGTDVDRQAQRMLNYLTAITDEYKTNFVRVAEDALQEERARERAKQQEVIGLTDIAELSPAIFPRLTEFVDDSLWGAGAFNQNYRLAKRQLQAWLDDGARRRPPIPDGSDRDVVGHASNGASR